MPTFSIFDRVKILTTVIEQQQVQIMALQQQMIIMAKGVDKVVGTNYAGMIQQAFDLQAREEEEERSGGVLREQKGEN
jgi:hypothetical protein